MVMDSVVWKEICRAFGSIGTQIIFTCLGPKNEKLKMKKFTKAALGTDNFLSLFPLKYVSRSSLQAIGIRKKET